MLEGLKLHLTKDEQEKVKKKPTENAEAYELFLKAQEYFARHTKSDFERALALYEEAVRLDPRFAVGYADIAIASLNLHRSYIRNEALLARAEAAAEKVRELEGETARYFWVMSKLALRRGDVGGALRFALRAVGVDPAYASGYDALGFAYQALGHREEAMQAWEESLRLDENDRTGHFNLLISLNELGDAPEARERLRNAAEQAIPVFERHVRLCPDDYHARVELANVFRYASRETDALVQAEKLSAVEALEGSALYNLACLYLHFHQPERGMSILRRSVEKGYRNIEAFRRDPDLDSLRDSSSPQHGEFEELVRTLIL